jgi:hypothetical protein
MEPITLKIDRIHLLAAAILAISMALWIVDWRLSRLERLAYEEMRQMEGQGRAQGAGEE